MKIQIPYFSRKGIMRLRLVMMIITVLTWTACQEEKPFALSENDLKMVDVLIDVYTVDAAIREYRDLDVKDSLKRAYFEQIYQIHDVDEAWLAAQRARLEAEPVRMDSVYTRALSAVELIKAKGRAK